MAKVAGLCHFSYFLYPLYLLYPYHQQTYIPFPDKSTLRFIPIDIASIHYG